MKRFIDGLVNLLGVGCCLYLAIDNYVHNNYALASMALFITALYLREFTRSK